ncbi:unnamed protein product [Staurois parvus]|uniref:Uncharacterized protein n=1 Tax=Staurois parvus TaxID=386267 RepID=A0ABN9D0J7_9NEOB|nr:unnamed protein product [Staurois parvus]
MNCTGTCRVFCVTVHTACKMHSICDLQHLSIMLMTPQTQVANTLRLLAPDGMALLHHMIQLQCISKSSAY